MQYRKFGKTDLVVSEIGFGAWAIGGGAMIGQTAIGWGATDDALSEKAIYTAVDKGVNFFDTADIYGMGHSEELLGRTIGSNKKIVIATKVGNVSRNDQFTIDYSKKHILEACEQSLRRLRRDTIDFYQLHSARMEQLMQGDCLEAMQQLRQQGKIRYWGLSLNTFQPLPEAEYLLEYGFGHGFQLVLNMLNQRALGLLKKSAAKGYGVIARMPLQFGLLTGKFDQGASFAENDHRKNRLVPAVVEAARTALAPVWTLCSKYNSTHTQLALSYVLSYPEVSTVIPGIRTPAQAELNTAGLFALEAKDRQLIEDMGNQAGAAVMKLIQQQG